MKFLKKVDWTILIPILFFAALIAFTLLHRALGTVTRVPTG